MLNKLATKALQKMGPLGLKIAKKSPIIFAAVGGVSIATGVVLACRATRKLDDTLDEIKEDIDEVKNPEPIINEQGMSVSVEAEPKDLARVYGMAFWKLVKLYGPAAICVVGGYACTIKGLVTLVKMNSALAASLSVAQNQLEHYRNNVRSELGEEKDKHFMFDTHKPVTVKEHSKEGDVEVTTEGKYPSHEGGLPSMYARVFDEGSIMWKGTSVNNELFLYGAQNYFNNLLQVRGWVTLNEVYDYLGLPTAKYGTIMGWVKNGDGNGHVDLGLYNIANRDIMVSDGYKCNYILDFNVRNIMNSDIFDVA